MKSMSLITLFTIACAPDKISAYPEETTDTGIALDTSLNENQQDTGMIVDTGLPEDTESTDTTEDTIEPDTGSTTDTQNSNPCPEDTICITQFPYSGSDNTTRSNLSEFNNYSCSPSVNESGPEIVYRLTLPDDGFLGVELPESQMGTGVDVDVHLLSSRDPNTCLDRGHWTAGSLLTAGEYWLVVDSWVSSSGTSKEGAYGLEIGFTRFSDFTNAGMSPTFAEDALFAFDAAWHAGETDRLEYTVTDFSLHSSLPRMWIWDLSQGYEEGNLHVAHGENSITGNDNGYASTFSNNSGSHQSSLGLMRAAESYYGSWDYSMRMDGLEAGYNDLVRPRAIVVHGWTGSRPEYINAYGSVAPTWGCPGIDDREIQWVVDLLKEGSLLFFWYPDGDWNVHSTYLQ